MTSFTGGCDIVVDVTKHDSYCHDGFVGDTALTNSLVLDLVYCAYAVVMLLAIAVTEAEKPINSLVAVHKQPKPKYGVQGVAVVKLMSTLTLLLCVPEFLHALSWHSSNPELSCQIQHHSLVINIAPTIFISMLTLMNFSYFIRGPARTALVQALKLSAADRRVVVWPTYRGFLLTEIAKVHTEQSSSRPMTITPKTSISAPPNLSDDAKENSDGGNARSGDMSAKQKKQNRPVLGVDSFDPENIRAWCRENCRREGVSAAVALRQFRPSPHSLFPVEENSVDFLFISYLVSHPYLNDNRDTEVVRQQKRTQLLADALRCVRPGGRLAFLNLTWGVESTEKLLAEAGVVEINTEQAQFWFSPFPSKLTIAKKPLNANQLLSDRSPIRPSPAFRPQHAPSPSSGMAIPNRFALAPGGTHSPILGRTPNIGSYHEGTGIMASSAISYGDHVPKPATGATAAGAVVTDGVAVAKQPSRSRMGSDAAGVAPGNGAVNGSGLVRGSVGSNSNPDLSRLDAALSKEQSQQQHRVTIAASPAISAGALSDDHDGPTPLSPEFIRGVTLSCAAAFAVIYGLMLFALGQYFCVFRVPTNIEWGNQLSSLMIGNVNSFWIASWAAFGQLESFLIHTSPTTNEAIKLLLKTIGTLILSLTVWNLVFWFPSFFLDVLLYGKIADATLDYINLAVNITIFWGIARGGPALVKYIQKRQADAELAEAALNAKGAQHPLMAEVERERSQIRHERATVVAASPAHGGDEKSTSLLSAAH